MDRRIVRSMRHIALPVLIAAALVGIGTSAAPGEEMIFHTAHLVVHTAGGDRFPFAVELAVTPEEEARGLMFRPSMAQDHGMLFIFPDADRRIFWMKNTLIPLDIIFIGKDKRIVNIAANATPLSESLIASTGPALRVLELNGGTAAKLGIRPGDTVSDPEPPPK